MSNVKKTLQMTSLLFGMITLFCYIAWSLGYEGFIIIGNIDLPKWLMRIISATLLCVNLSLLGGFVLNIYSCNILYFSLPIAISSAIGSIWLPWGIFTGPVPIVVLIIFILHFKLGKWGFIKLAIAIGVTFLHQWVTSKITCITLSTCVSIYQGLRLSINAILLMLLLYSIGGELYYGRRLELLIFPGRVRDDRIRNESHQSISQSSEDVPVNNFEQWVMRSVIAVVQVLQWIFILWVCNLDNLFLDALVMTTSFVCHGMIISKRKHLKPIIVCTLAATAMFYFAARFTISFQYSHFFPIVIGLLLVYTVYRISYQFEKAIEDKMKNELERIKALETQLDKAWSRIDEISD